MTGQAFLARRILANIIQVSLFLDRQGIRKSLIAKFDAFVNGLLYGNNTSHILTVSHIIEELYDHELWPLSEIMQCSNLSELLDWALRIETCRGKGCACSEMELRVNFTGWVQQALASERGLCLDCFRQGKLSKGEGNCQGELQCKQQQGK